MEAPAIDASTADPPTADASTADAPSGDGPTAGASTVETAPEPRPPGRGGAERAARASSPLREWPLMLVLAVAAVGLVVVVAREFKSGAFVVGLAPLLAAALRAVLPTREVGLLAVRGRFVDVITMLVLGVGLTTLAVAVPAGH